MFTDKNRFVPWQENGRWYEFFVESDGSDIALTSSDYVGAAISGSYLQIAKDFHAVDYVVDLNADATAAATFNKGIRIYADGSQGVVLPDKATFDYAKVYVFGYLA